MRRLKLSVKLPALIVLAVLLTAGASSLLAIVIGRNILRATALEANINSVQTYASAIDLYLDNARSNLESTADLSEITDMTSARLIDPALHGLPADIDMPKRALAARILEHSKIFEYIMLLQADGSVYLLEPYALQVQLSRHDLAFTAWYTELMRTGHTVMSNLHISTATQRPTIVIATPVRGTAGQIRGIWAGALKLAELSQIGHGGLESGTLQRYGYITDRRGLIIAHQAKPKYVQEQTDFSAVPPVRAALTGQSGVAQFVNPIERVEELAAYLPLARLPVGGGLHGTYARGFCTDRAPDTQYCGGLGGVGGCARLTQCTCRAAHCRTSRSAHCGGRKDWHWRSDATHRGAHW